MILIFIYLKLEGRMSLLPKVHFRPCLEVFIMFPAAPLADVLVFSTFQMIYSSQRLSWSQPASQDFFLFPRSLGLHSVIIILSYVGLYCCYWRCMWYKRKAQTLEVGRWVMSLGLCDSDALPPSPNLNLLLFKMGIIVPFWQSCHEN